MVLTDEETLAAGKAAARLGPYPRPDPHAPPRDLSDPQWRARLREVWLRTVHG